MTSSDLQADGFYTWLLFNRASGSAVTEQAPRGKGVVVIRRKTLEQRRTGESDIIFVGVAANYSGVRQRLSEVLHPGHLQSTHLRLLALVARSDEYQVGWTLTGSKDEAEALKKRILEKFFHDHTELPRENKRW